MTDSDEKASANDATREPEPKATSQNATTAQAPAKPSKQPSAAAHALRAVGALGAAVEPEAPAGAREPPKDAASDPNGAVPEPPASAVESNDGVAPAAEAPDGSPAPVVAPGPVSIPAPASFQQRRPRPVLGPSLWIAGALLWAYVVMGEWVVTIELPETLGWLTVLAAYAGSWVFAVRRLAPQERRATLTVVPGILAVFWFVFVVAFTTSLFGSPRRSTVAALTVMLWFVSAAMFALGRQLTARRQHKLKGWRRVGVAALWVISGLGTLVSLLAAMERA